MCVVLSASELFALFFCSLDPQEVKKIAVAEQISAVNLSLFMILNF
jgi:PIN domain nuclease of toxin-antitoxin system